MKAFPFNVAESRTKRLLAVLALTGILVSLPATVMGQGESSLESPFRMGVGAIYFVNGGSGNDGIGLGAFLRHYESAEISLNFRLAHIDGLDSPWFDLAVTPVELTAIYNVGISPESQVYFGGGAGAYFFHVDNNVSGIDVDVDDSLGYHLLVGLERQLNKNTSLFGEIRHLHLRPKVTLKGGASLNVSEYGLLHAVTNNLTEGIGDYEFFIGITKTF